MVEASPLHLLATIDEIDTPVWRLLRLDPELRLDQVRVALQIAFGWEPGPTPGFLGLRADDPQTPRTWAAAAAVAAGAMDSTAFPGTRAETWDTLGEALAEAGGELLFNAEPDVERVLVLARDEAPEDAAAASAPAALVDAAGSVSLDGAEVAPSIPSRKRHLERVNRALAEAVGPPPARVAAAPAITAELAAQLVAPFQRLIELIPAAGLRLDYGWRLPMDVLGELARVLAAEPGSGESSLDGPIPGGPAAGQPSPGRSRPDGSRPGGSDAEEPSPAESRPGGLAAGWLAPGESELDPFDAAESAAEVGLPAIAASGRVADQARRLGLIRLAKGFYHRTKAAQSLVDDPLGLWRHIAGRAFAGAMQPTDRCGGILLCCAIGEGLTAPWTAYARLVADGLDQVGWQHPDHSPITATEAEALTWATATLLRTLGVWSRRWDAEIDPEAALTPTPPGVRAAQELVRLSLPADVDQTLAGIRGQMQENVANELLQNFQGLDDAVAWDGEDPDDPADDESQDNRVGEELGEDEDWDDEEDWDEDWDEDDDQDWDDDGDWDEADEEDGDDGEDDRPLTKQQEAAAFEEMWDFFGGVFERMLEMTDPDRLRGNSDRE